MEPQRQQAASEPVAASSSRSSLTIRTPSSQNPSVHDSSEAGGGGDAITVKCGDPALGAVTHHWATVESVLIGDHPAIVWYSPSRDAAYAHVKESEKCQQGQVRIVAKCRRKAQGVYRYITPYKYAAIKIQDKVSFVQSLDWLGGRKCKLIGHKQSAPPLMRPDKQRQAFTEVSRVPAGKITARLWW